MTTIKDVAKHAKVSVATVSRVLNQKGYVSKEAKQAVESAIKVLNYKPNAVARTLYHKTSGMIGLMIPDISNPFFPELARAIEDAALKEGYTVVLCNTDDQVKKEQHYLHALQQKYVDGVILATGTDSYDHYLALNLPVVGLDRFVSNKIPTVVSDNKKGAIAATEHLVEKGCQFITHLRGPKGLAPADERYQGFKEVVETHGVAHIIVEADFQIERAEAVTRGLLQKHPTIDGIFTSSDVTAAGAMKAAHTCKRVIPDDLQIVGFDGIPFGNMLVPSLTTVQQPIYEMGERATQLLIQLIEKKTMDSYWHELPTTLIQRQTTRGGGGHE
ncbi:LacI family DNA-binding transcriptional regulator [Shouchella shacheensis]|uniref:LacI family DNA-binding transcriptional regulator n=1 Tax=Shouchella shacheensis TaxID=1649580 RepID=UPI00073FCFAF|nr:LacI family DNA-binding transcriptional regulator [Shouchella shacheensis]